MNDELTENDMQIADAAYWAATSRIRLQKGYFSFDRREYLHEPMSNRPKRTCYMKATQGGVTELEVNKSLHGMIFRWYSRGVLYLFPTANDIGAFSNARFGPLISANPRSIGRYVVSTNSTFLKRVGDAFLFLRGGTLPKKLDFQAEEAAALRGISVDRVVFDELDLMDPTVNAKARERMGDSDIAEEVYISNPTLPDYGIAEQFKKSDQRHWFRKCECGEFTCAELAFPDCVKIRPDGTGYIACGKCGREVPPSPGEWVPQCPANTDYMHGYRWSQLSSYTRDPAEILGAYTNPPEGNLGDVIRLKLGLPYVAAEDRLRPAEVLGCCAEYGQLSKHEGPCAMGVDCQKPKRVVIGARTGRDAYSIFRVMPYSDTNWDGLIRIALSFNVKSAVVDIRPYEDSAREFQKRLKRVGILCFLCEYAENTPAGSQFNTKSGLCKVNRTEIMDATHRLVTTFGKLNLPHRSPEIEEYARQMCNTAKILEVNRTTRRSVYRYRKLGSGVGDKDDYRHATNYFYLACQSGRVGTASAYSRRQRQTYASDDRGQRRPEAPTKPGRKAYAVG
jgi:hypothetical protein